jgi:hypothetical protein
MENGAAPHEENARRVGSYKLALIGGTLLVATGAAAAVSLHAGQAMSSKLRSRLEVLWPDVLELPKPDRAALVRDATSCKLEREPCDSSAIAECLRQGAESLNATWPDSSARLERLLETASKEPQPVGCR